MHIRFHSWPAVPRTGTGREFQCSRLNPSPLTWEVVRNRHLCARVRLDDSTTMIADTKNMTAGNRPVRGHQPTIGAGFARGLVEVAVLRGADRQKLLERAAIAADDLADQDNRIPFPKYMALMRAGQEFADDPALALHF